MPVLGNYLIGVPVESFSEIFFVTRTNLKLAIREGEFALRALSAVRSVEVSHCRLWRKSGFIHLSVVRR